MKVAIIPARGGSNRIPRKNIKLFLGKPIIAYSIETALKSKLFDEVIVSTDDVEIAEIAINYGAKVPFLRSQKNSDDFATTSDVLIEVLDFYSKNFLNLESACCIYPTSPLIDSEDLLKANSIFELGKFDAIIASVVNSFPIQRAFKLNNEKEIQLLQPDLIEVRSQDLELTFHDAGSFYFFKVPEFQKNKTLWKGKVGSYQLSESKVQDIDNFEDWKLAEIKYSQLLK